MAPSPSKSRLPKEPRLRLPQESSPPRDLRLPQESRLPSESRLLPLNPDEEAVTPNAKAYTETLTVQRAPRLPCLSGKERAQHFRGVFSWRTRAAHETRRKTNKRRDTHRTDRRTLLEEPSEGYSSKPCRSLLAGTLGSMHPTKPLPCSCHWGFDLPSAPSRSFHAPSKSPRLQDLHAPLRLHAPSRLRAPTLENKAPTSAPSTTAIPARTSRQTLWGDICCWPARQAKGSRALACLTRASAPHPAPGQVWSSATT